MSTKVLIWLFVFGLALLLGAGGYYYILTKNDHAKNTVETLPTPSTNASVVSPNPTPSISPSAVVGRDFNDRQNLAQPNLVETLPPGGSLALLAQNHNVSVRDLTQLNGLADANKVLSGQKVIIPDSVSGNTYLLLYLLNLQRLKKEEQQLAQGTSIYADPITAAQADVKGIFSLQADTPYSKSNETEKTVTLSTTDEQKIVSIQLEKQTAGLWLVKKVTIKLLDKVTE
jgi:LysM repeat protein